jgi:hypothetical protein
VGTVDLRLGVHMDLEQDMGQELRQLGDHMDQDTVHHKDQVLGLRRQADRMDQREELHQYMDPGTVQGMERQHKDLGTVRRLRWDQGMEQGMAPRTVEAHTPDMGLR